VLTQTHHHRLLTAGLVLALVSLAMAAPSRAQVAAEGTFEGNWDLSGYAETVAMDDGEISVMKLEGPVRITSAASGLAREFDSVCAGVSDKKTGGIGRCVWTDGDGDTLLVELSGSIIGPAGTSREALGVVAGGTGKYADIKGSFDVDWLFIESVLEPGKVMGRDTKFTGAWWTP